MPPSEAQINKFSETLRSLHSRYERREPQIHFYKSLSQAFHKPERSLLELATGEGKSSAIIMATLDRLQQFPDDKILIATSSKKLQQQLLEQFTQISKIHDTVHEASNLFGKNNYLCAHKINTHQHSYQQLNSQISQDIDTLKIWASQTAHAEREALHFDVDLKAWNALSPPKENCPPEHCTDACALQKARKEAAKGSVIITNHARLLEDFQLPPEKRISHKRSLIIDEASELHKAIHAKQSQSFCPQEELKRAHSHQVKHSLKILDQDCRTFLSQNSSAQTQHPFSLDLTELYQHADTRLKAKLADFLNPQSLSWLDYDDYHQAPCFYSFSQSQNESFHDHSEAIIFCGAHLSHDKQDQHFTRQNQLTLHNSESIPPSYKLADKINTLSYPELPAVDEPNFFEQALTEFQKNSSADSSHKLILFNSYSALKTFLQLAQERQISQNFIAQNPQTSNSQIIEQFSQAQNATLLATHSFFIGIDFPNNILTDLYLMRLPFDNPESISRKIKDRICQENKLHPFSDSALIDAITLFRQAAGRLIRHSQDSGTLHIFDKRIITKSYGQKFLNSLK